MKRRYNNKKQLPKQTLRDYKNMYLRKMQYRDAYFLVDISRDAAYPLRELSKWGLANDGVKDLKPIFMYWRYKLYVDAILFARERYMFYYNTVESKVLKYLVYDYIKENEDGYRKSFKDYTY